MGPAGDKFRGSGTKDTVGGAGANKVSGVLSGADFRQRMDIQDKGDGTRRRQVPLSGTKDTVGGAEANKVSGVLSGADCMQRMDIQDKGDGTRRRQVPRQRDEGHAAERRTRSGT